MLWPKARRRRLWQRTKNRSKSVAEQWSSQLFSHRNRFITYISWILPTTSPPLALFLFSFLPTGKLYETVEVTTFYRSRHSSVLMHKSFSTFPGVRFFSFLPEAQTSKSTWKGRDISTPAPRPLPIYTCGKSGAMWFILFDKHPIFSEVF